MRRTRPTTRLQTPPMTTDPCAGVPPLLPARIVNEYVYCPRLAYLEWAQGEWADSADTIDGRHVHRRVDRRGGRIDLPSEQEKPDAPVHARSVELGSERLGLIARIDLVEGTGLDVTPVDTKRGRRPHVAQGVYEPERVQLAVQALLLEEHGFRVAQGVIYYAASRERVPVPIDAPLRERALRAAADLRAALAAEAAPEPLVDSPKCPRCSLVGICLPDELNFLRAPAAPPRPLAVADDDRRPLHVQAQFAKVAKDGETLEVSIDDAPPQRVRLAEVSQLALFGNVYLTTPALHELMRRSIPVSWHGRGGWFLGHTVGTGHHNVAVRTAQYRASFDDARCLAIARGLVAAKVQNSRTLLRRNWKDGAIPPDVLTGFRQDFAAAARARDLGTLLGVEGNAAARYFAHFGRMLGDAASAAGFDFGARNRRPPRDPVNALLSFAYALLTRSLTVALSAVGLDPYRGFCHQPRFGRPALALDLMEPFRPLLADSAVLTALNNGEVGAGDFVRAAGAVALTERGRRSFIAVFERRMEQRVTHPLFGYELTYRRLLEVQCRLFGRYLLGELDRYPHFVTR